jgi:Glyoxalase-like domain
MTLALDHLVLVARTLGEGIAWCEATLGVRPEAGGQHALMGTHNRIFSIASAEFSRAYFEIIAIDPSLPAPAHARWFGLDDLVLQRALERGPQLVHWVARCDDIVATGAQLREQGIDVGALRAAERGALRWRISVRNDGHRPLDGAVPALIHWHEGHPTDTLAESGVRLESMAVSGWPDALVAMLPPAILHDRSRASPPIRIGLVCPLGRVTLNASRTGG